MMRSLDIHQNIHENIVGCSKSRRLSIQHKNKKVSTKNDV